MLYAREASPFPKMCFEEAALKGRDKISDFIMASVKPAYYLANIRS